MNLVWSIIILKGNQDENIKKKCIIKTLHTQNVTSGLVVVDIKSVISTVNIKMSQMHGLVLLSIEGGGEETCNADGPDCS